MAVGSKANAQPSLLELPNTSTLKEFKQEPKQKPKIKKITVKQGDTLGEIAKANKTTWQRLFYKNLHIRHPDKIAVGQKFTVPKSSEKLKKRNIPTENLSTSTEPLRAPNKVATDNGYGYGYCTWYVKNRRPDIPNSWGNADTWDDYAPSSGYTVSDKPRAGAIGVTRAYMHVVYIEKVIGNTVLVSEMNYQGWNVISQRVAPISEFRYIL